MENFVDRSRKEAADAIAGTWLLLCLALITELGPPTVTDVMVSGLLGAVLIIVGCSTTSRCRLLPARRNAERAKFAVLSLCAGIAAGAVILGSQLGLATTDPGIHAQWARYVGEPVWRPLARAFGAAVVEEGAFRLFGMSVIAWAAARFAKRPAGVFPIALGASALLFGLVHLPDLSLVGLTVVLLTGAGGLLLG